MSSVVNGVWQANSDATLLAALRARDPAALAHLRKRYRPVAERLVRAHGAAALHVESATDELFAAAIEAATITDQIPTDFAALLCESLRRAEVETPDTSSSITADQARASGADLIASWRMMLWAVHVDQRDRTSAAQAAGIPGQEADSVLRRAREALASGVIARERERAGPSHTEFLQLLELDFLGQIDEVGAIRSADHTAACARCRATLEWLSALRSDPGAVWAAVVLGSAGPAYLRLVAAHRSRLAVTRAAAWLPRNGLVSIGAAAGALMLLLVAVVLPDTIEQTTDAPVPVAPVVVDRSTGGSPGGGFGAGAPVTPPTTVRTTNSDDPRSTGQTDRSTPILPTTAPQTAGGGPGTTATDAPIRTDAPSSAGDDGGQAGGDPAATGTAPDGGTAVDTSPSGSAVFPPGANTSPSAAPTTARAPGTTAPGTTAPGTTAPGMTAPGTTAPGTTRPGTTAPSTIAPGTSVPSRPSPSSPSQSAPSTSTVPTTPPSSGSPSSPSTPPSLVGVVLDDDWASVTIRPGLGFSASTTLRNTSDRTSATVVVTATTPTSVLMSMSTDRSPCAGTGLLTRTVSCTVGPLAPGETVRLTWSAVLPLTLLTPQRATVTLGEQV
ncbi:MAG: hypothetical protein INR72_13660 [Williamsia herbipolensis]|nr:hypothetical protein [Williamsia herbipolensis]